MISRITGKLVGVDDHSAEIVAGAITYCVLIPSNINKQILSELGGEVSLFTYHYYEGSTKGGSLVPRLVGFVDEIDREFFLVFTGVQGISTRKALKAFVMPIDKIAAAIETGEARTLTSLPGIGARAAQKIIADLKGKCTKFALKRRLEQACDTTIEIDFRDEAMDVLTQLQYKPVEADRMIENALRVNPALDNIDELLSAIFNQMKDSEK